MKNFLQAFTEYKLGLHYGVPNNAIIYFEKTNEFICFWYFDEKTIKRLGGEICYKRKKENIS